MSGPWNTDAPLGAYLRRARRAGIDQTVVFAALSNDYPVANAQVARIVSRLPDRLIGFVFVDCHRDAGRIMEMVRTAVRRWGFRGIKVHGYDAMPTRVASLRARLRAFQLAQGLPADGRLGPMTFMQLNRTAGVEEPRLRIEP